MTDEHALTPFLAASEYVDSDHPAIVAKAADLARGCASDEEVAAVCFAFVRDQIRHSKDAIADPHNPLTCRASDVLAERTGYCYAKSHLLAALLRANAIPAALMYQRLSTGASGAPYCLHGLNAVHLKQHGWYRADARGNKPGVDARFTPPREQLAFALQDDNERDDSELWAEPMPLVVTALLSHATVAELALNLPRFAGYASRLTVAAGRFFVKKVFIHGILLL